MMECDVVETWVKPVGDLPSALAAAQQAKIQRPHNVHFTDEGYAALADQVVASILPALPNIKSGKFRVLGVSTPKRSNILPDVVTIAEAGVPGYELVSWYGILMPARTPEAIITRLNQTVSLAVQTGEVQEKLIEQGVEPATSTPAELGQYIKTEIAKWSKVVKDAGIQHD